MRKVLSSLDVRCSGLQRTLPPSFHASGATTPQLILDPDSRWTAYNAKFAISPVLQAYWFALSLGLALIGGRIMLYWLR